MAHSAAVDLMHVRGAAALRESIAALDEQIMRAQLTMIAGPLSWPAATPPPVSELTDDEYNTSAAGRPNDSLQRLSDRIGELRGHAAALLGTEMLDALLLSDTEPMRDTARAAFDAMVDQSPSYASWPESLRTTAAA